jgi:putative spermidine/putrescine transport system permease protein
MSTIGLSSRPIKAVAASLFGPGFLSRLGGLFMFAPLALYMGIIFITPIALFLFRAVDNSEIPTGLPNTVAAVRSWDGKSPPPSTVFDALEQDMHQSDGAILASVARRLNYEDSGMRSLVMRTAARLREPSTLGARERLVEIDSRWGQTETWTLLKSESGRFTPFYLLSALDLRWSDGLHMAPPDQRIYLGLFWRTFTISASVTLICLAIGFPFAFILSRLKSGSANLLMLFVLTPFWTSVIVRTAAWILLFQADGPVNRILLKLNLIEAPLQLIFNRVGVLVAMVHVLLPFMIFPLYSTMKSIPGNYMRAATALGAPPWQAFVDVYLPQAAPGIAAGCILVFISAIGYYVTPALIGGAGDQMISYFIALNVGQTVNWGLAAALSILLLTAVLILYRVYASLSGRAG